ncbi:hypothetical protein JKP88DRAFT_250409 [Tribonema minus]|uniref:Uncharacterized protein n=1 Tax=Tribonema minus TaxID=303371 RepID=A0A836C870_9STRA|nr:hypothetical protein JKP88DRAFT_250409 [Tribonema minus]
MARTGAGVCCVPSAAAQDFLEDKPELSWTQRHTVGANSYSMEDAQRDATRKCFEFLLGANAPCFIYVVCDNTCLAVPQSATHVMYASRAPSCKPPHISRELPINCACEQADHVALMQQIDALDAPAGASPSAAQIAPLELNYELNCGSGVKAAEQLMRQAEPQMNYAERHPCPKPKEALHPDPIAQRAYYCDSLPIKLCCYRHSGRKRKRYRRS